MKCTQHGKDALHPFKSGAVFLQIASHLKMIQISGKDLEKTSNEIYNAHYNRKFTKDIPYNGITKGTIKRVQNNARVLEILENLYSKKVMKKRDFVDLILRVIIFHQAFYGLPHIPPFSELTISQIVHYFKPEFFVLMKVMMKNDSLSYLIFASNKRSENMKVYLQMFEESFDNLNKVYDQRSK